MDSEYLQLMECLGGAVAVIDRELVLWCSQEAQKLGLKPNMAVTELLPDGISAESLASVRQLDLPKVGEGVYAQICPIGEKLALVLHHIASDMDTDALAQIARKLREPLNDMLPTTRLLFERLEELEDPRIQSQTATLNRGYYRLVRMATELNDILDEPREGAINPQMVEVNAWMRMRMREAESAISTVGKHLKLTAPRKSVFARMDPDLIAQALWCLLSNAVAYSPEGSTIAVDFSEADGQCTITMRNPVVEASVLYRLTGGLSRPMEIGDSHHGLGVGILRTQHIVQRHGGVLLLSQSPEGEFVACLRIPTRLRSERLCAPRLQVETLGGFNRMLVELSEVLPDGAYDSRNL